MANFRNMYHSSSVSVSRTVSKMPEVLMGEGVEGALTLDKNS